MQKNYANLGAQLPDVGSLDKRITIQNYTTSRTGSGAQEESWDDWRTVWAKIEYPNTGNTEDIMTDQQMITRRARFVIRYTGQVQEKWRIVYNDEVYDILRVVPMGRARFEDITAELRK